MDDLTFGLRLKHARKRQEMTTYALAAALGVTPATVSRWENDQRQPDIKMLRSIAGILSVNSDYLLGYSNDESIDEEPKDRGNLRGPVMGEEQMLMVPMISPQVKVCAGNGNAYEQIEWQQQGTFPVFDGKLAAMYSNDGLLCMTVEGDSMEPMIHDGDVVLFDHDTQWVEGDVYVVCLNGRLMVKGLMSNGGNVNPPKLRSANKDYRDIVVEDNDFFLIYGRVLRVFTARAPMPVI